MARIEKSVFLSYRRTNLPWALAIFQNLRQHGYDVFFDYNGIASGDFEQVIIGNIKASAHFIVVLTPSALERCDDPADWLRREIETALANQRNIVPLMLEGFDFGTPEIANQLTGKLAALKRYNGLKIPPEYFDEAMERLRNRYLNIPLTAVLHPTSFAAQKAAALQMAGADAAPAVEEKELTSQQWFERGTARRNKGDLDGAIKDYSEAIRLKPNAAAAFLGRGLARSIKGDSNGAITDYSEAIWLEPNFAFAFAGRGDARFEKRDLNGAINDFSEAIRLKPDFAVAFAGRGIARAKIRDSYGAIKDFSEAIRLKPDDVSSLINRGIVLYNKGDFEEAIKDYSDAILLEPECAAAFGGRSLARRFKGDLQGANEDFERAKRLKATAVRKVSTKGIFSSIVQKLPRLFRRVSGTFDGKTLHKW
jgi:tetratricopeptide (TPR) repeat protein